MSSRFPPPEAVCPPDAGVRTALRALIVDGSPNQRLYLTMALTIAGFDVTAVSTGAIALERALRLAPALVCVDVSLPDVAGMEVFEALRAHPVTADVPVIVTASAGRSGAGEHAYEAGADDFVVKPVDPLTFGVRALSVVQRRAITVA